jgi:4-hydroxy-tetrahydrodipicolinate synthase
MSVKQIAGLNVFSVTPIGKDEQIDLARFKSHVTFLADSGVHGVTLFGSTGSNGSFAAGEKMAALDAVLEAVGDRIPVMMGIGSITTAEAKSLGKHAERAGASAVLTVPINYWTPSERELIQHYQSLADAIALPFWIYNNPGLAGVDITPSMVQKLAATANIVGIKESSGDYTRIVRIPQLTAGKVNVGIGYESFVVEPIALGARAWFTGMGNVLPVQCVQLWEAAKDRDFSKVFGLARDMFALAETIGRLGHVRVAAEALDLLGRSVGYPRQPLMPLTPEDRAELSKAVAQFASK